MELHEETESELEEERVPTPEIMKKEDEDLDTDQVTQHSHSLLLPIKLCIIAPILAQLDLQFDKKKHFVLRVSCCCPGIIEGLFIDYIIKKVVVVVGRRC